MTEKRIYLRRLLVTDAPILLKWGQAEHYHKMAGFEKIDNMIQARKIAQKYALRPNSFAICLIKNQKMIGIVELYERGLDVQSGLLKTKEIGFLLDREFEGHGYMQEALQLIFYDFFINNGQVEIWAGTFVNNIKSQNLLQRLGFKYVYTTDYAKISPLFSYCEKYYLLKKEEWLKIYSNTKS